MRIQKFFAVVAGVLAFSVIGAFAQDAADDTPVADDAPIIVVDDGDEVCVSDSEDGTEECMDVAAAPREIRLPGVYVRHWVEGGKLKILCRNVPDRVCAIIRARAATTP